MSFALDLRKFAEKAEERADEVVGSVVISIAATIDDLSPVGDPTQWSEEFKKVGKELGWFGDGYVGGRFRGNWQLGVDTVPQGVLDRIDPRGSEQAQTQIIASVPDEAAGKVYWLVNNLPYARRLEYGYSKQAPKGMVGITAVQFQQKVREAVAKLP